MWGTGKGFVPDRIVPGTMVTIVGQAPGEHEETGRRITEYIGPRQFLTETCVPQPFVGPTGWALEHTYLPHTGLDRDEVSYSNSLRCRWQGKNDLPPKKILQEALKHCRQYDTPHDGLTVATGGPAMAAMTGVIAPVGDWRGYLLPRSEPGSVAPLASDIWTPKLTDAKVLVTYHVAFVQENPWLRPVAVRDWQKVKRILAGTWPLRLPLIYGQPPRVWPKKSAFDTEFHKDYLLRYSVAYHEGHGKCVHVVEREDSFMRPVVEPGSTIVMQNAEADLGFMEKILGKVDVKVEDTMYAHAVLWSDLDHDLNFGGSLYASINRWKHLSVTNPRVYSAGDAIATLDWWEGMEGEFQRDPRSRWVYDNCLLPQLHVIRAARRKGVKVNHGRIGPACDELGSTMKQALLRAQASAGFPLNLDSPKQVASQLYDVERIGAKKGS